MLPLNTRVYLAVGPSDMRKSINGLSIFIQSQMALDPFSDHLFAFCNRRRNLVKILYWDRNGFCLWQKRLERDRLNWPQSPQQVMTLDGRQLHWLLEGLDIQQRKAHKSLFFSTAG
jgi:transposase